MIKISSKIFNYSKPILIAEISGNHGGSKKRFIKLINSAYNNGADIVKIQTYEPSDITIKKKIITLKLKVVLGKINIYGSFIKKLKLHINGITMHLKLQKKEKRLFLVVHLV